MKEFDLVEFKSSNKNLPNQKAYIKSIEGDIITLMHWFNESGELMPVDYFKNINNIQASFVVHVNNILT